MSLAASLERPVRAGIYRNIFIADRAVKALLDAGFSHAEITVLCSDEAKEQYFREFEHQKPAGANTPTSVAIGGTVGATVGGLAAVAATMGTGAIEPLIVGAAATATGGALGGFIGAMLTRGEERELANFYDQHVEEGQILGAVDVQGEDAEPRLFRAEQILDETGGGAIQLPEG